MWKNITRCSPRVIHLRSGTLLDRSPCIVNSLKTLLRNHLLECTNAHNNFSRSRITSMANFRIKYTSCVSKTARETDVEIKIAKKYTDIFG